MAAKKSVVAAKAAYNAANYQSIMLRVRLGGRDTLQDLAAVSGVSVAAWIRRAIVSEAARMGYDVRGAILCNSDEIEDRR